MAGAGHQVLGGRCRTPGAKWQVRRPGTRYTGIIDSNQAPSGRYQLSADRYQIQLDIYQASDLRFQFQNNMCNATDIRGHISEIRRRGYFDPNLTIIALRNEFE